MTEILDKINADTQAAKRKALQKLLRHLTEGELGKFKRIFGDTVAKDKLDDAVLICVRTIRGNGESQGNLKRLLKKGGE